MTEIRPMTAWRRTCGWLLLAALHVLPFATRPALIGGDEVHYALLAHSIAADADVDLHDDYAAVASGSTAAGRKRAGQVLDAHVRTVAGHELSTHPVGVPLLAAPLVFLQQAIAPGSPPDVLLVGCTLLLTFAALLAAWRALAAHLGDRELAALWVFGGYFSSPLWFYSRTFFTEPFTWSLGVLSLAALRAQRLALGSLLLGLTLLTKETALLLVVPILLGTYLLMGLRRAALLAIGPALAACAYLLKNLLLGLPALTTSQTFQAGDPLRGLAGLLLDGRHGLLPFAPLLALGALGALVGWSGLRVERTSLVLSLLALAVVAGYLLVHAAWVDWRGGSCYGPRLLVPALPALVLLAALRGPATGIHRAGLRLVFAIGFAVSTCAALAPWRAFWGATPLELVRSHPLGALVAAAAGLLAAARSARRRPVAAL